jgi:hypothetical protein
MAGEKVGATWHGGGEAGKWRGARGGADERRQSEESMTSVDNVNQSMYDFFRSVVMFTASNWYDHGETSTTPIPLFQQQTEYPASWRRRKRLAMAFSHPFLCGRESIDWKRQIHKGMKTQWHQQTSPLTLVSSGATVSRKIAQTLCITDS